jgi:Fe-S cluster assembly protein SufD
MPPDMSTGFADRLQQEFAAVRAALPDSIVDAASRRRALERAAERGLPGLREEGWRYAALRPLATATLAPPLAAGKDSTAQSLLPAALDGIARIVFLDGRFAPALSTDPAALQGLRLRTAGSGTAPPQDPPLPDATADERFAWLNEAFAVDAARLDVSHDAQLELVFASTRQSDAAASHPRLEIRLAPGSRLTLVERHVGGGAGALVNTAVTVLVGRDATLEHLRLHDSAPETLFLDSLLASVGANARYSLTQLQLGAASARSALRIGLDGEAAALDLRGMSVTDGRRVHDTTIQVTHSARSTTSEQLLRAIAKDRSGTSMASRVDVAASAGGADSRQSLKGLLGGPGAEVNLRPQLEISTDEVKASHGATTGAIDENMLFYLLSRGIDPSTARQLLEWAFLEDVLSRIALPDVRRQVELATLGHLGNTAAEEALR